MNTIPPLVAPLGSAEVVYPTEDGEPMAETGPHVWVLVRLLVLLQQRFRDRSDVYVAGNMFLFYEEGNPEARRSPDVMVIKGVPSTPERDSFKIWVEKAVPCVVIEATSEKTKEEDQGPKKDLYQRLGVREYLLFDPKHEYLPRQLIGYRLIRKASDTGDKGDVVAEYEELPCDAQGGIVSAELGVRLVPNGERLTLIDYRTGQTLLEPERAEQERQRAEQEHQRAEQAERAAEQERQGRELERQRVEQEHQRAEQAERAAEQERQGRELERQRAEQAEQVARQERQRAEQAEQARQQLEQEIARLRRTGRCLPAGQKRTPEGEGPLWLPLRHRRRLRAGAPTVGRRGGHFAAHVAP